MISSSHVRYCATRTSHLIHIDQPTMANQKRVICWFYNDQNPFSVQIDPDKTTTELKDVIVEKYHERLGTILPHFYYLYLVNIPDTQEARENFSFAERNVLRRLEKIIQHFWEGFLEKTIQFALEPPGQNDQRAQRCYRREVP
jgi:hypothetical protein